MIEFHLKNLGLLLIRLPLNAGKTPSRSLEIHSSNILFLYFVHLAWWSLTLHPVMAQLIAAPLVFSVSSFELIGFIMHFQWARQLSKKDSVCSWAPMV